MADHRVTIGRPALFYSIDGAQELGYKFRKPLEVALYELNGEFTALHFLPSEPSYNAFATSEALEAKGNTDTEACIGLAKMLIARHEELQAASKYLDPKFESQKKYFESILVKE